MEFLLFELKHIYCHHIKLSWFILVNFFHIFRFYLGPTISFNVVNRPPKFSETDFDGEWNK